MRLKKRRKKKPSDGIISISKCVLLKHSFVSFFFPSFFLFFCISNEYLSLMINTVKKKKKIYSVGIFFFVSKYEKQKKKLYYTCICCSSMYKDRDKKKYTDTHLWGKRWRTAVLIKWMFNFQVSSVDFFLLVNQWDKSTVSIIVVVVVFCSLVIRRW